MTKQHIIVHGKVQGVGFRNFVQSKALQLGMKGWVRNKNDGTVEIKAEGEDSAMQMFIAAVQNGSTMSSVDYLDIHETDTVDHNDRFHITY
ncbi:acylphosphatase [Alteribacillus persepolensis]|uniref:Acylphosphatase n=1 Tax=Alteribacillus persepolensis TaxID=568899 RepID=A0A1G8DAX4_9BACI|nr:acylphosphatase [Alteribacillus persepolensis]SDH54948.1 acylphosphatase [Alteribacillus persepolensis]